MGKFCLHRAPGRLYTPRVILTDRGSVSVGDGGSLGDEDYVLGTKRPRVALWVTRCETQLSPRVLRLMKWKASRSYLSLGPGLRVMTVRRQLPRCVALVPLFRLRLSIVSLSIRGKALSCPIISKVLPRSNVPTMYGRPLSDRCNRFRL